MRNNHNKTHGSEAPHQLARHFRAAPMSEQQYEDFYVEAANQYGLRAKHKAALQKGTSLLVKSQTVPHYSIPFEEYIQQDTPAETGSL